MTAPNVTLIPSFLNEGEADRLLEAHSVRGRL